MTVTEKMRWLEREWKGIVSVYYRGETSIGGGMFYVMVGYGNQMVVVPDSFAETSEEAVDKAISRWNNRSEKKPFVW